MNKIIENLKGKLIVSCQALDGNPLRDTECIARLAEAAVQGGAAAIRANGAEDIKAIKARIKVPIIGIDKKTASETIPYITPDFSMAQAVYAAGADIVALDATLRRRECGLSAAELIRRIKTELKVLVMADISTLEEGVMAAEAGADLVATTLSGYTAYTAKGTGPDLDLVEKLCRAIPLPVIAEGRYLTPQDVDAGFESGAHAVVVGKMITNAVFITRFFINNSHRIVK